MTIPKVGDGYQVGDGNLNETEQVGRNGQSVKVAGTTATSSKLGFYGATPIVQRTAAVLTSAVATASSADVTTTLKAAVIDIMNTLAALNLWSAS